MFKTETSPLSFNHFIIHELEIITVKSIIIAIIIKRNIKTLVIKTLISIAEKYHKIDK